MRGEQRKITDKHTKTHTPTHPLLQVFSLRPLAYGLRACTFGHPTNEIYAHYDDQTRLVYVKKRFDMSFLGPTARCCTLLLLATAAPTTPTAAAAAAAAAENDRPSDLLNVKHNTH